MAEWLLISSVPFTYWLLISEWIFLVAVIFFFNTQFLREKALKLLIKKQFIGCCELPEVY
jgi:hypothetical protein